MKLSDYVIDFIAKQGVADIFEFIGGAITHLIDSTVKRKDLHCVSVHHEQSGAFAAEAYARINGKLGVAMATSGPGALNMVTGIGSCYFDSVPCLFITGQVNTYEYKFDRPVRQIGFQETDIVSVVKPLTKYATMVVSPETIRYHLEKAVYLAQSGRPGPVLLDIPMDVQRAQIEPELLQAFVGSEEHQQLQNINPPSEHDLEEVIRSIKAARRPVILAGGGVRTAGAVEELSALIDLTDIPVVTSLMGLDSIPHHRLAFQGMIGAYGNRFSNMTIANSDLLLIFGSRLDSRQTGTRPDTFARGAKKIHVDIDPLELQAKVCVDLAVHCDLKIFLQTLTNYLAGQPRPDIGDWLATIDGYRRNYPTHLASAVPGNNNPNLLMAELSIAAGEGDIVTLDVGQNQMWAAQSLQLKNGQRLLVSGGMGAMGFALPAAMGAALAVPGKRVIAIAGDGGIQINIQDLDTVARRQLPVKVIVFNNGCLGMVRQFQDMYFGGRRQSTVNGYSCPDLCRIAEAYGLPAFTVEGLSDARNVFAKAMAMPGPVFVNVILDRDSCVNPKLVVNRPIEDMSPELDREELAEAMIVDMLTEKD